MHQKLFTARNKTKMASAPHRPHPWPPQAGVRWRPLPQASPHAGGDKDEVLRTPAGSISLPSPNNGHQWQTKPWKAGVPSWVTLPLRWARLPSGACAAILTAPLRCGGKKITNYWGKTPFYPDSEKKGLCLRFSLNCKQLTLFPGCWNIWYICEIEGWWKTHPLGQFVSTY